jgi:aryl-alcohol dehydrogenase-like predicted oxidoreductase
MEKIRLGRTGLSVTAVGLGCGGFSRIGIEKHGEKHASEIVRAAYEQGINFFDTAAVYETESAVGRGLEAIPRDRYILSTKFPLFDAEWRLEGETRFTQTLERSLRALKTDYIDVYHLHGVPPENYADARDLFMPLMQKAKESGKIRFIGITERFMFDTSHKMLQAAIPENIFDVAMLGYNMLNPSAAKTVLPLAIEKDTGVLCMFAVRRALADPKQLKKEIEKIMDAGQAGADLRADEDMLDFLSRAADGGAPAPARSTMDAAYRFCRHTDGIHVVLTGTGSREHLTENIRSVLSPPLPDAVLARLKALFGNVDCVCAQ